MSGASERIVQGLSSALWAALRNCVQIREVLAGGGRRASRPPHALARGARVPASLPPVGQGTLRYLVVGGGPPIDPERLATVAAVLGPALWAVEQSHGRTRTALPGAAPVPVLVRPAGRERPSTAPPHDRRKPCAGASVPTRGRLRSTAAATTTCRLSRPIGYPSVLVDHVRIRPGEEIIGRVFSTRRAACERVPRRREHGAPATISRRFLHGGAA